MELGLILPSRKPDVDNIISAAAAIVDGEIIKADTWYTVRGGKFVEAEEA